MKVKWDITQKRIYSAVDRLLATEKIKSDKHNGNPHLKVISNQAPLGGSPNY